jgi:hypothetical protein
MRFPSNRFLLGTLFLSLTALVGCEAPGVGDPCVPEAIPPDPGFSPLEIYLETSSVQCRTRVCMVYQFEGNPSESLQECEAPGGSGENCGAKPPQELIDEAVFCTCRCDTTTEGASTCECPDGFSCAPILDEEAGPGIAGSYCVRDSLLEDAT